MNTLDDDFNPPNSDNTETSPSLGRTLLRIGYVLIGIDLILNFLYLRLILNEYANDNPTIGINFRVMHIFGILLTPLAIGTYLIIIGKRFNTLSNDHNPEGYTKLLSLKIQLFLIIMIWLLIIAAASLGYAPL